MTAPDSLSPSRRADLRILERKPHPRRLSGVKIYLIAYNILSTLGWAYIFIFTLIHLFNLDGKSDSIPLPITKSATSFLTDMFSSSSRSLESRLPHTLKPLYRRSKTTYSRIGPQTTILQTLAILEVVHVFLGWVRASLQTTLMQVFSRLYLVWGIVEMVPEVRPDPLFTSMILAWSLSEIIRYPFYALNLLGYSPYPLLWVRYSAFYALYIIGASSEAFLNYATLPKSSPIPGKQSWPLGAWRLIDYGRAFLFLVWWPALYVLYAHMISQRRKALGKAKTLKRE